MKRQSLCVKILHSLFVGATGDCRAHAMIGTSAEDHEEHRWAFKLHLQDATASVVALVWTINGDTFFTVDEVLRLSTFGAGPL